MGTALPIRQDDYLQHLKLYFGNFYDCKEIKREIDYLSGGLSKVAKELDVERIGTMHQAGSDSYVTAAVYFKLKQKLKKLWNMEIDSRIEERLNGKLFGIGDSINDEIYIDQYKNVATKSLYIDETGHVNLKLLTDTRVPGNIPQSTSGQGHIASIISGRDGSHNGVMPSPQ